MFLLFLFSSDFKIYSLYLLRFVGKLYSLKCHNKEFVQSYDEKPEVPLPYSYEQLL